MKAIPSSPYTPTPSTSTIPSSPYSAIHRLKEQLLLWIVPLALCSPSPSLLWCPSLAPLLPPNT